MTAALAAVALVAAVAAAAAAEPPPGVTERLSFSEWRRRSWPARGCRLVVAFADQLQYRCGLSAARLTIDVDRALSDLRLGCETDDEQPRRLSCEELRNYTSEALATYTGEVLRRVGASPGPAGAGRVLNLLHLDACELSEPLQCLLEPVAASDVTELRLWRMSSPLLPEHVRGLNSVTKLLLYYTAPRADANVTRVPHAALQALPALRRLELWGEALQPLQLGGDWRLRRLLALSVHRLELRALPARAFLGLPQLRNLSLSANEIEAVDENAFEGLPQLQHVWLNENRLRLLAGALLLPARRLRLLDLSSNPVASLPLLGHLRHLEELRLDGMDESLSLYNDTFSGLSALSRLQLQWCALAELPAALLAEQSALRHLQLSHNGLHSLPPTLLRNTRALKELILANNHLLYLPDGVFSSLAELETLDLSHNYLMYLFP